jgi:hypothetical protein
MATCADALVQAAARSGIKLCFANPGTTEMWLVSALDKEKSVRSVLGLHEAVCSGASDGYVSIDEDIHKRPQMILCNSALHFFTVNRQWPFVTVFEAEYHCELS